LDNGTPTSSASNLPGYLFPPGRLIGKGGEANRDRDRQVARALKAEGKVDSFPLNEGLGEAQEHDVQPSRLQLYRTSGREVQPMDLSHPHHIAHHPAFVDLHRRRRGRFTSRQPISCSTVVPNEEIHRRVRAGPTLLLNEGHGPGPSTVHLDLRSIGPATAPTRREKESGKGEDQGPKDSVHATNFWKPTAPSIPWGLPRTEQPGNVGGGPNSNSAENVHFQLCRPKMMSPNHTSIPSARGLVNLGSLLLLLVVPFGPPAAAQTGGMSQDATRAGRFDMGKMWTFENAPMDYFTDTYGFQADQAWFDGARLAALRIPGCSAAFVSPNGLVVTNHHCARSAVGRVTREGETLLDDGFYATSLDEERPIPNYYVDQLVAVEDVSDELLQALDQAPTDAGREEARQEVISRIQARISPRHSGGEGTIRVEVTALYNGGRYSAYTYRRFTDVRMVAAAELQLGFFGGDPDNFTYPRYALDFAFLRVYGSDGQPLETEHFFTWSQDGVEEGDVVFVIGNPGPTNRLNTVTQLEFQRDVSVAAQKSFLGSRLAIMKEFYEAHPDEGEAMGLRDQMFGLSNSLKANSGRLNALRDPVIMARKADGERLFQASSVRLR